MIAPSQRKVIERLQRGGDKPAKKQRNSGLDAIAEGMPVLGVRMMPNKQAAKSLIQALGRQGKRGGYRIMPDGQAVVTVYSLPQQAVAQQEQISLHENDNH
jgi:hypothetical protein